MLFLVLIEALCIVNDSKINTCVKNIFVLIEALCIVNAENEKLNYIFETVLIEALCIVNGAKSRRRSHTAKSFNRSIMYCKCSHEEYAPYLMLSFNRSIIISLRSTISSVNSKF